MGQMVLPFGGWIKMTLVTRSSPLIFPLQILSQFRTPSSSQMVLMRVLPHPQPHELKGIGSVAATWVSANDLIKCL